MSNQESKLLALKILQILESIFNKALNWFSLALVTIVLAYIVKTNGGDLATVNKYISCFAELMVLLVIGTFIYGISLSLNDTRSVTVDEFFHRCTSLMIKSWFVTWIISDVETMKGTTVNHATTSLVIWVICLFLASFVFGVAKGVLGRFIIDECIDLDYIKLKDYKVTDSFIAEEYKDIEVETQSLSITKDGSDAVKLAKGHVTFKVLKLPVKLDFVISPYMSGTLVSNEAQIRFETGERPLGIAKQIKKTIKI